MLRTFAWCFGNVNNMKFFKCEACSADIANKCTCDGCSIASVKARQTIVWTPLLEQSEFAIWNPVSWDYPDDTHDLLDAVLKSIFYFEGQGIPKGASQKMCSKKAHLPHVEAVKVCLFPYTIYFF